MKNRFVGGAEMHKELLNRESLRAEDGLTYFKDTLRPIYQRNLECFPLQILSIYSSKKRRH